MKPTLIIIFALLVIPLHGLTQSYNKLIEPTKNWQILTYGPQVCNVDHGLEYFFNGDTVLNGITYAKLYEYVITPLLGGSIFCPPVGVDRSVSYLASWYMREDSITKQVYVTDGITSEWLEFDFSLNVGDTISNTTTIDCVPNYLIIDSIVPYTLMNGVVSKIFYLNNGGYYIEGIGSSKGLSKGFCLPNEDLVLCVKLNNVELYSQTLFSFFGCIGTVGINSTKYKAIKMLNENNYLSFENLPTTLKIISYSISTEVGALVKKGNISGDEKISTKDLNTGLYLIQLSNIDKIIFTNKFTVIKH